MKIGPQRIVCLSTETTELLYALGEQGRIVGISGFTVRPPQARREKPKVSAFTSAKIDEIVRLQPDLVLGFSDLQAPIAAELIGAGVEVHVFNQRSVEQIFNFIRTLGYMVNAQVRTDKLVAQLDRNIQTVCETASRFTQRPRVYFEEWNEPMITGIRWVSDLITIAGGEDCFADLALLPNAKQRIIQDSQEVVRRRPDIIIGSWCGKKFRPEKVAARDGWKEVPAVQHGHIYEIKSSDILCPGLAALTDGLCQMHKCIKQWAQAAPG